MSFEPWLKYWPGFFFVIFLFFSQFLSLTNSYANLSKRPLTLNTVGNRFMSHKQIGIILMKLTLTLALLVGFHQPVFSQFPYESSSATELTSLGSGAALFALGFWADAGDVENRPLISEEIATLDPKLLLGMDRSATRKWSPASGKLSDFLMYSAALAPLSLSLTDRGSPEAKTLTFMHVETLLINGGATYLLKNLFRRTRPFVYNQDPRIPDSLRMSRTARRSFPSGHTSTAFASMVFMATVYGQMYPESETKNWVWAGCLATAGVTGYMRYSAGYHFPTDILAGAALGAFTGWLVPQLHEVSSDSPADASAKGHMVVGLTLNF